MSSEKRPMLRPGSTMGNVIIAESSFALLCGLLLYFQSVCPRALRDAPCYQQLSFDPRCASRDPGHFSQGGGNCPAHRQSRSSPLPVNSQVFQHTCVKDTPLSHLASDSSISFNPFYLWIEPAY